MSYAKKVAQSGCFMHIPNVILDIRRGRHNIGRTDARRPSKNYTYKPRSDPYGLLCAAFIVFIRRPLPRAAPGTPQGETVAQLAFGQLLSKTCLWPPTWAAARIHGRPASGRPSVLEPSAMGGNLRTLINRQAFPWTGALRGHPASVPAWCWPRDTLSQGCGR